MPLPPSTNARLMRNKRLAPASRSYLECISMELSLWGRRTGFKTIKTFKVVEVWFILPPNSDCHNYFKLLFDCWQRAGLTTNDRYLLPRVMGVYYAKETEVIVRI